MSNPKGSRTRTLTVLLVICGLLAVSMVLYTAHLKGVEALVLLESHLGYLEQQEKQLLIKKNEGESAKQDFARVRKTVRGKLGDKHLARIQAPICDSWTTVAKETGFQVASCKPTIGRWQQMIVEGPTSGKDRFYQGIESDLHPVILRSVILYSLGPDRQRIVFNLMDSYNTKYEIPLAPDASMDPEPLPDGFLLWYQKRKLERIGKRIHELAATILDLHSLVKVQEESKIRERLLSQVLSRTDHPENRPFDIKSMERSADL